MNSPGPFHWRTLTDESALMQPGKRLDPPNAAKKSGSFLKRSRIQGSESAPIVRLSPSIETRLDISDPTWSDLAVTSWRIFQSCPERGGRCFLADLPLEVFSHLAGFLQVQDLLRLGSVSKRLFVRCSSKQVWRSRLPRAIPNVLLSSLSNLRPFRGVEWPLTTPIEAPLEDLLIKMMAQKLTHLEIKLERLKDVLSVQPDLIQDIMDLLITSGITRSLVTDLPLALPPLIFRGKDDNQMILQARHADVSFALRKNTFESPFARLHHLELSKPPGGEVGTLALSLLLVNSRNLTSLSVLQYQILSDASDEIPLLQLQELRLSKCEFVSPQGIISGHEPLLAHVLLQSPELKTLVLRGGNCRLRRGDCAAIAALGTRLENLLLDPSPHDAYMVNVLRHCPRIRALMLDDPPPEHLYSLSAEFLWFSSVLEPSAPLTHLRSLAMNCHITPRFGPALARFAPNLQRLELQLGPLTKNCLSAIALGCPQLHWLRIAGYLVVDDAIPALCLFRQMRTFGVIGPLYEVDWKNQSLAGIRGAMTQFPPETIALLGAAWPQLEELRLPAIFGNEGGKPLTEVKAWLDRIGDAFPRLKRLSALVSPTQHGRIQLVGSREPRWRCLEQWLDFAPDSPAANIFVAHFGVNMIPGLENFWRTPRQL